MSVGKEKIAIKKERGIIQLFIPYQVPDNIQIDIAHVLRDCDFLPAERII